MLTQSLGNRHYFLCLHKHTSIGKVGRVQKATKFSAIQLSRRILRVPYREGRKTAYRVLGYRGKKNGKNGVPTPSLSTLASTILSRPHYNIIRTQLFRHSNFARCQKGSWRVGVRRRGGGWISALSNRSTNKILHIQVSIRFLRPSTFSPSPPLSPPPPRLCQHYPWRKRGAQKKKKQRIYRYNKRVLAFHVISPPCKTQILGWCT